MNDNTATKVVGNCQSSPDITIASAGLINSIVWRPILTLASDHLPIHISINRPPNFVSADHRTFVNFKKANWTGFTVFTKNAFSALPTPTDVTSGERSFRCRPLHPGRPNCENPPQFPDQSGGFNRKARHPPLLRSWESPNQWFKRGDSDRSKQSQAEKVGGALKVLQPLPWGNQALGYSQVAV